MILIDKPYASDYLIKTIKDFNLPIVATDVAKEMISDKDLNWISEEDAIRTVSENPREILYSNSENSISWIERNLSMTYLPDRIKLFKNKIFFRDLLKKKYPDYFYLGVAYEDLKTLDISKLNFPIILKPAVGFFSIAVHKLDDASEWDGVLVKVDKAIEKLKKAYPKEVIDGTDFIIEEIIQGEEFAVDCYFDENGDPIVLNIMQHFFATENDVNDRVYSTSKKIIEKYKWEIVKFLNFLSNSAKLKNFPAHIEIRVDKNKNINAIEVNPMRFGGWCTSADLSWHAYQLNTYECVQSQNHPEWQKIFERKEGKKYSVIVLDNNSGIPEEDIDDFDYDLLLSDFKKPLELRKVDYKKFTIFGFLFVETPEGDDTELEQILNSDLRRYIIRK